MPVKLVATREESTFQPIREALSESWNWPTWVEWKIGFELPGRHFFLIEIAEQTAGLAKLIDHGKGEIEIESFGLIDEFVGKGFGGETLALVVDEAWKLADKHVGGFIWFHTCNWDHPNALVLRQVPFASFARVGIVCLARRKAQT